MVWTHKPKDLKITKTTGHACSGQGILGRAPGVSGIHFTPLELFGAAARCSHLHFVNPALATPESLMVAALIEQYVDDTSTDFAILASAGNFKDFVKSYFVGTVAAGLAYLAMIRDGYQWCDHFENVTGGNSSVTRTPDFVFTGHRRGVALLESKGTRSSGLSAFDSTVEAGYLSQVEPHLGHFVGGSNATHGFSIGSWMTSATKAEMLVHHTDVLATSGDEEDLGSPALEVQRHNYATAMQLVYGPGLASQLRTGIIEYVPPMLRFEWLDRQWLVRPRWAGQSFPERLYFQDWWALVAEIDDSHSLPFASFAIEESTAKTLFSNFAVGDRPVARPLELRPVSPDVIERARNDYGGQAGAVFPDGLAIIGWKNRLWRDPPSRAELVRWDRNARRFAGDE